MWEAKKGIGRPSVSEREGENEPTFVYVYLGLANLYSIIIISFHLYLLNITFVY